VDFKLQFDHPLWHELTAQNPKWWQNLKSDPDIYCDIRKDNYLNFYYNGGSLLRLRWDNGFKAEIHCEYVPLKADRAYLPFEFGDSEAKMTSPGIIDIQNFAKAPLARIKKRIRKSYPDNSEKGIQGHYVTRALQAKKRNGFFIDTEFEYQGKRMDLVWVDVKTKKIAFVELKRKADAGLFPSSGSTRQSIEDQLKKYSAFIKKNQIELLAYYDLVFRIKKKLGLLKGFSRFKSLRNFELLEKPILLVGDCNQAWIDVHAAQLNAKVAQYSFGCVFQGPSTFSFQIPFETSGNSYRFHEPEQKGSYSGVGLPVIPRRTDFDPEAWIREKYPEMAQGAEFPKGPLGKIKLHFAQGFAFWDIVLPEEAVAGRLRGKICKAGWAIWFLFDSDEDGEYLDYYCAHRMTNDGHVRIYEDGRCICLPAIPDFRIGSPDPEKDAQLEKEYNEEVQQVAELLEAKGFGIKGDEPVSVQIQRYQRLEDKGK
jgi:hypothetical protein